MKRIDSIDFLRGLVMVIMALDHTRDLFHMDVMTQDPTNLQTTTPLLFFTRWITHLCAPTFVFLSGISVYFSSVKVGNKASTRRFLLSRGLWLIFLEFTVINFGIWFDMTFGIFMSQVIAAIGFGFLFLSLLLGLSSNVIGIIGLVIIVGHNLLAGVSFPDGTFIHYIWGYLFKLSFWQVNPKLAFLVNYPLIPWLGVMLAGYGFGKYFYINIAKRRKIFLQYGLAAISLFIILRAFNIYGDPQPWALQKNGVYTFLSFLNVNKYPPSLLYISVTIGNSLLVLCFVDGKENRFTRIFASYGKVPMFYYIIHWYLLHCSLIGLLLFQGFRWSELNFVPFKFGRPDGQNGVSLFGVYVIWQLAVALLYPICKWYGLYKSKHPEKWWLRYL